MPRNPNYPIQGEFRGGRSIITNLNSIRNALDTTRLAATKTFAIDRQVKNLGIQMGYNAAQTTQMAETITGLSNVTGLSTDKTGELVNAMAAAGLSAGEFDSTLKNTTDTFGALSEGGAENLEMMAELIGRHKLSAAAVVRTNASLRNMGIGLKDLTNKVTVWQKNYQIPGMLAQMPQAVAFAEKSMISFKALLGVSAEKIIADTMKTGAIFAKVYGVDIGAAIQMAQQNQQHFLQQQATNADVFLGLSDSYSPLTNAMFEVGMQFEQIQALMKKGQEDPAAYAEQVLSMKKQLEATYGKGSNFVQRWYQQTLRASSEQAKMYLTEKDALKKYRDAQAEAARIAKTSQGVGGKAFEDMTRKFRAVGATVLETFHNLLTLGKTILGLTIADNLTKSFEGLHAWIKRVNTGVRRFSENFAQWMRDNPKIVSGVQQVIKAGVILGGLLGSLAGTATSLIIPFKTLEALLTRLPLIGGRASSVFGGIGKVFSTVANKILLPIGIIYAAIKAFDDFGKALKNPSLTGPEKLLNGVRAVFVGIVSAFDDLLMGIPTKIVKSFFPSMRGSLVDGVKRLFISLQAQMISSGGTASTTVFQQIQIWFGEKMDQIWAWMSTKLGGWRESAKEMGANVGRALGQLAKWAWDGIKWLFNPSNWKRGWDRVVRWFNGDGGPALNDSFTNIFLGIGTVISDFVVSARDEILGSFGTSWDEVWLRLQDFGDRFKEWTIWLKDVGVGHVKMAWLNIKDSVIDSMATVADKVLSGWAKIKEMSAKAADWILNFVIGPLVRGYAEIALGAAKSDYLANDDRAAWVEAQKLYSERMKIANRAPDAAAAAARISANEDALALLKTTKGAQAAIQKEREALLVNQGKAEAEYEDRRAERARAAASRLEEARQKARQTGDGIRARREAERTNAERLGAWADQLRGGFVARTEAIITSLHSEQSRATEAGNSRTATRLDGKIEDMRETLNHFKTLKNPDQMQELMTRVEKYAGADAMREARATPAYGIELPSARPELVDVKAAVRAARERAAPTPPAPAPAPAENPLGMGIGVQAVKDMNSMTLTLRYDTTQKADDLFTVNGPDRLQLPISFGMGW